MKLVLASVSLVALVGMGAAVYFRAGHKTPPRVSDDAASLAAADETAPTAAAIAELRGQVAALRTEVALLRAQIKTPSAPTPPMPEPKPSAPEKPALREIGSTAQAEMEQRMRIEAVAANFQRQVVDGAWAPVATQVLRKALDADETLRTAGGKLDCRSQTCRLELLEDSPGKLGDKLQPMLAQVGGTLPRATLDYSDEGAGKTRIVVYLDRQSEPVPTTRN